jgi:hypothetical protein
VVLAFVNLMGTSKKPMNLNNTGIVLAGTGLRPLTASLSADRLDVYHRYDDGCRREFRGARASSGKS